jgi:hypothetical protein
MFSLSLVDMSKKGTKKIYPQSRWNRSASRKIKEANLIFNPNNMNTVQIKSVEKGLNENNAFEDATTLNASPTETQLNPRRGKYLRKNMKRMTNKQRQRLNFRQTRKQREREIEKGRQMKQTEREFEHVDLEDEEVNKTPNIASLNSENFFNRLAREAQEEYEEEEEMKRLEKENQKKQMRKAQKEYEKVEKNTFYFRTNDEKLKKINILTEFFKILDDPRITKIEFAYLDHNIQNSYYYILKYGEDQYNNNSMNNYYDNDQYVRRRMAYRRRPPHVDRYYKVYTRNPVELFKPILIPHYWNFYGPNNNDDGFNVFGAKYIEELNKIDLKSFFQKLPGVREKLAKEKQAKATAPAKLKELQLKAVDAAAQQFEQKTGKYVPQNAQNIIEQFLKPINYRYYQGRDNLQRIQTNVIQTQANNGREQFRKINTGLFQK